MPTRIVWILLKALMLSFPESFIHSFFSKGTFVILPKHFKTLTIKIMFGDTNAWILKIKKQDKLKLVEV